MGAFAEARVMLAFMREGFAVLRPFSDTERYDLVIERGGQCLKIQVKTGRLSNGTIRYHLQSQTNYKLKKPTSYRTYEKEVDFIVIYCFDLDQLYILPADTRVWWLRVTPPKNNQKKNLVWAKDYEFDRTIASVVGASERSHRARKR